MCHSAHCVPGTSLVSLTSHCRVTLPSQTLIFKITKDSVRNTAGNEEAGI